MLLFGRIIDIVTLAALIGSTLLYILASVRRSEGIARAARGLFMLATASVIAAVADLGTLLVTHRFDSDYVYNHSAKATDPLYWFPSMWAGQEGSFLLWAFWTGILGVALAFSARKAESRVMPIYNGVFIFLASMLVIRSPFLPLDTHGLPIPTEGLGLNPNLENPWMVIHPPTLFLGFSALAAPFAYGLSAMIWRDWDNWLRRALPWGLFAFSLLGLAMMMGGYWAYEMLGWGGFWGWDPVENGPLIPWLGIVAFLHSAQVQRVRRGLAGTTLAFAMLPFVLGLYETFLTRTGILDKFSVHSFSTLGGVGNDVLLYVLLGTFAIVVAALIWRRRSISGGSNVWDLPGSREFGYLMSVVLVTLCGLISTIGMSAPLLTTIGVHLHLVSHVASVKEDFYNRATYPIALLLSIGMGVGPYLAWRKWSPDQQKLMWFYATSVVAAVLFTVARATLGSTVFGWQLAAQLLLFAASFFALIANGYLLIGKIAARRTPLPPPLSPPGNGEQELSIPSRPAEVPRMASATRAITAGGVISHMGVAVLFIGIVCLVTFVRKDPDVLLQKGISTSVLDGAYNITYLGQTGDYKKDRNNALRFAVESKDGREKFTTHLPFAMRVMENGTPMLFAHPGIAHHVGSDLYFALKDGPDEVYRTPRVKVTIGLGETKPVGPYDIELVRFDRDPAAAKFVLTTGQMPATFPVTAVLRVKYDGAVSTITPQFIMHGFDPSNAESPEVKLPGGWLASFEGMNAGSSDINQNSGGMGETATLAVREDSGPPTEAFELDVTTRPMIDLVWIGTLMMVLGGLISMRRRIAENRAAGDLDLDTARPDVVGNAKNGHNGSGKNGASKARRRAVVSR